MTSDKHVCEGLEIPSFEAPSRWTAGGCNGKTVPSIVWMLLFRDRCTVPLLYKAIEIHSSHQVANRWCSPPLGPYSMHERCTVPPDRSGHNATKGGIAHICCRKNTALQKISLCFHATEEGPRVAWQKMACTIRSH